MLAIILVFLNQLKVVRIGSNNEQDEIEISQ